jgi:hypothetical protein
MRTRPARRAAIQPRAERRETARRGGGNFKRRHALTKAAADLAPAMAKLAEVSRTDPAVFCQFVLRHEQTGAPILLAPMHVEWHDLIDSSERVVLTCHTESGKTSQLSVGRVLWEIGTNPNIRILILSSAAGASKRIVKTLKTYIENSAEYRAVFPHVRPDKSDTTGLWRADAFHVARSTISKDPTVQASGFEGAILGARYDLIIIDDYLTPENTYSEHLREKYHSWLKSTIEGRRTDSARLWFIGNAWHHDDAAHRYAKEPATAHRKYPVRDAEGRSSWPEVWPDARIDKEIANRGPIESRRSLFCDPVADAERRFKAAYILRALREGNGLELAWALSVVPPGYRTITGVDLGATKKKKSDLTAFVTIAVEERTGRRQLLDVTSGKLSGPEIVAAIKDLHRRYNSLMIVESNAAQAYIKQFVEEGSAVPVRAFYTGKNKVDPTFGLESIAVEMSAGKWVLPNQGGTLEGTIDPEVLALINEMLRYDPRSHTGDRLMAMWFAREGVRLATGIQQGKRPRRT